MRTGLALLITLASPAVFAQADPDAFPAAAVAFLNTELSQMEKAVAENDRAFFQTGTRRVQSFLESWGLKSAHPIALERYTMCVDAVTDYLIVGLCLISPPGSVCEPSTFFPKFKDNLQRCRDAMRANRPMQPVGLPVDRES
jgi:hypothetical protein